MSLVVFDFLILCNTYHSYTFKRIYSHSKKQRKLLDTSKYRKGRGIAKIGKEIIKYTD